VCVCAVCCVLFVVRCVLCVVLNGVCCVVCSMFCFVCCMLCFVFYVLCAVCCMLYVVSCVLCAVCFVLRVLFAVCCVLCVLCCVFYAVCVVFAACDQTCYLAGGVLALTSGVYLWFSLCFPIIFIIRAVTCPTRGLGTRGGLCTMQKPLGLRCGITLLFGWWSTCAYDWCISLVCLVLSNYIHYTCSHMPPREGWEQGSDSARCRNPLDYEVVSPCYLAGGVLVLTSGAYLWFSLCFPIIFIIRAVTCPTRGLGTRVGLCTMQKPLGLRGGITLLFG